MFDINSISNSDLYTHNFYDLKVASSNNNVVDININDNKILILPSKNIPINVESSNINILNTILHENKLTLFPNNQLLTDIITSTPNRIEIIKIANTCILKILEDCQKI